jgi:hypothetical protein
MQPTLTINDGPDGSIIIRCYCGEYDRNHDRYDELEKQARVFKHGGACPPNSHPSWRQPRRRLPFVRSKQAIGDVVPVPDGLLRALRERAGAVIAALRHDHRSRYSETGSEGSQ